MTLREAITEKRKEFWRDSDSAEMGEELELIIDQIDTIEVRIDALEEASVRNSERFDSMGDRIHELESGVVNFNKYIHNLKPFPTTQPQEPFPGYNNLMKEAIPVIRECIAKKKYDLMKNPYDLSGAHDFTGPGEHPEE